MTFRCLVPVLPALLLAAAMPALLPAQDRRDSLVTSASNEFDAGRRVELLVEAVNPANGPLTGAWPTGVQLLAQTLMEDGQDSLAGVWLRWAARLSPEFQPDTVQFLPKVVAAQRAARAFSDSTSSPADSLAPTRWVWPERAAAGVPGRLQLAASPVAASLQVTVEGLGALGSGPGLSPPPGSYTLTATAAGYDKLSVTREVLPDVTTVVELRPRASSPGLAGGPGAPAGAVVGRKRKKFPWLVVVGGAAAVGAVAALAGGGKTTPPPPPPTTGTIKFFFPNP